MKKTNATKNKQLAKPSVKLYGSPRKALIILGIVLFASIGAYLTFSTKANPNVSSGNVHMDISPMPPSPVSNAPGDWTAGTFVTVKFWTELYNYGNTTYQLLVDFRHDPRDINLVSVECKSPTGCYKSGSDYIYDATTRHKSGFTTCIDLPPPNSSIGRHDIFTITLRLPKDYSAPNVPGDTWMSSFNSWSGYAPGSCQDNPTAKGAMYTAGRGVGCGETWVDGNGNYRGGTSPCGPEQDIGNVPFNGFSTAIANPSTTPTNIEQPTDNQGNSVNTSHPTPQPNPTSNSSNGGSTIATNQSNENAAIPSPSPQGETTEQPKLEPSPFFDGRQFNPGSIQLDSGILTDTSSEGASRYWPMFALTLIIAAAGFIGWHYWRNIRK